MIGVEIQSQMHTQQNDNASSSNDPQQDDVATDTFDILQCSPADRQRLIDQQRRMCESLEENVIFDSIGRHFHVSVFLQQFWAHIFFPAFFRLPNLVGQGLRLDPFSIAFNVFFPCMFYVMLCSYATLSRQDKHLVGYSLFWPFFSFVAHRAMVALKYAALSRTEYRRFNECQDAKRSATYLGQMMLFSGWLRFEANLIAFELGAAAARIGERINELHILIRNEQENTDARNQVLYWNAFLRGHTELTHTTTLAPEMRQLPSGEYAISVYDLCLAVLRHCNAHSSYFLFSNRLVGVFVWSMIAIALIPIVQNASSFEHPRLVLLYVISSSILNVGFGGILLSFLSLVLYDVLRLQKMMQVVHAMVRLTDVTSQFSVSSAMVPQSLWSRLVSLFCEKAEVKRQRQEEEADLIRTEMQEAEAHRRELIHLTAYQPLQMSLSQTQTQSKTQAKTPLRHRRPPQATNEDETGLDLPQSSQHPKDPQYPHPSNSPSSSIRHSTILPHHHASHGQLAMIPRITFAYPENVLAWTSLRLTLQAFGDRFRFRTDVYAAFMLFVMLILMVVTLLFLFISEDTVAEFQRTYVIQSLVAVTCLVLFLCLISFVGALVNTELHMHRCTLASHLMHIRSRAVFFFDHRQQNTINNDVDDDGDKSDIGELTPSDNTSHKSETAAEQQQSITTEAATAAVVVLTRNQQNVQLLESMLKIIDVHNQLRPFKFLGMMATFPLTISIVTTAVSFYSIIFSLYFSAVSQANTPLSPVR